MNNVSATLLDPQATEQSARDAAAVALQYGAHDHLICTERHGGGQQEVLARAVDALQHVLVDDILERILDVEELMVTARLDHGLRGGRVVNIEKRGDYGGGSRVDVEFRPGGQSRHVGR